MGVLRIAGMTLAGVALMAAVPASAQFFMKSKDLSGAPVTGQEAGLGLTMPGATPAEWRAGLIWNMRAALNVAALQCQFEPTLLTVDNYNSLLTDHRDELKASFDTLTKYFTRTNKGVRAAQTALDQFGTRTYATYATVSAQYNFCETAHSIGRDALFTPRGKFGALTFDRMRELRNSLVPWGEQNFPRSYYATTFTTPRLDPICWSKKGEWIEKKCGTLAWPAAIVQAAAIATR